MIIGHSKQQKYLDNLVKNGTLGHAYLFTGPEMTGKKSVAFQIGRSLLGDNFAEDPDFKLIAPNIESGESRIYIEDMRDLKKFMSLKSYGGNRRLVIIDEAHCLTNEASNAILKILEEPPAGSTLILVSSFPGLLLPTIFSRCEKISFNPVGEKEVRAYLESKKLNKDDRDFLIKLAGGRIGFIEFLIRENGIVEARKAIDDLRKLLGTGIYEKIDYAKKIHEKGNYETVIGYWLSWVSAHVHQSPKNEKIVKDLLSLRYIASQPQNNHRLALENFLLNL